MVEIFLVCLRKDFIITVQARAYTHAKISVLFWIGRLSHLSILGESHGQFV